MKGKKAMTGLLAMGIVIALATLGLVYGNWTQTLHIGGSVTTSGLNAEFILKGDPVDNEPAGSKQVGDCDAELLADPVTGKDKGLTITIENAYPNYACSISGGIQNTGQMPITVVAKQPSVEIQRPDGTWVPFDPASIGVKVSERPCDDEEGKQLMPAVGTTPGETLQCKLDISFSNKNAAGESPLPEKAAFRFSWDINICQFDKAC